MHLGYANIEDALYSDDSRITISARFYPSSGLAGFTATAGELSEVVEADIQSSALYDLPGIDLLY